VDENAELIGRSGEEAIAFFARHGTNTTLKFVYCNRARTPMPSKRGLNLALTAAAPPLSPSVVGAAVAAAVEQVASASASASARGDPHSPSSAAAASPVPPSATLTSTAGAGAGAPGLTGTAGDAEGELDGAAGGAAASHPMADVYAALEEYRPYDLVVVSRKQLDAEYFTISANGLVHMPGSGQPSECISLSEWMHQSTAFNTLRSIGFFKHYLEAKCFRLWRANVRYRKYRQKQLLLHRNGYLARRTFCAPLMAIRRELYECESVRLYHIGPLQAQAQGMETEKLAQDFQKHQVGGGRWGRWAVLCCAVLCCAVL
jgi:hypothetical protein